MNLLKLIKKEYKHLTCYLFIEAQWFNNKYFLLNFKIHILGLPSEFNVQKFLGITETFHHHIKQIKIIKEPNLSEEQKLLIDK